MKEVLNALLPIKEATGLEIDIYSNVGDLKCTTQDSKPDYKFRYHKTEEFVESLILDYDSLVTYFLIESQNKSLVGVISGANSASKNYAIIVKKLVETILDKPTSVLDRNESFKLLFNGGLSASQTNALKSSFSNKPFNYYSLSLFTEKMTELKDFLQTMSEPDDIIIAIDKSTTAYFKQCGLEDEYQSASDFASILYENIKEELRISLEISIGGIIHSFDELVTSYKQSVFAHDYGKLMEPNNHLFSYKEYIMIRMLSDIPAESLDSYLDTLIDPSSISTLSDDELMQTADVFLKNSLNISETSREMYMHRNTLIYRLDKIENATGLNIRHFNDALVFRLIVILNKLKNKDKKL